MLALLLLASFQSVDTVRYEVSYPNAVHHEAEISVTIEAAGRDTVEFRMSRSSPGRYALHEFAKNVYSVSAVNGAGRRLPIIRDNPSSWRVTGHDGTVKFNYTLFADRAGGTYTGIDATHAHMNIPATFMWVPGSEQSPVRVSFSVPEGSRWRAATQLIPLQQAMAFAAPDLQYFMDSPTELSDQLLELALELV
jgi:predicted metalloprotease with PDZ domain